MNSEPRELCSSGIVFKNALQSRNKGLIQRMELTDLLKPNSDITHSSTDCWPSSALATAVMCGKHNFRGQRISKKEIKLFRQ